MAPAGEFERVAGGELERASVERIALFASTLTRALSSYHTTGLHTDFWRVCTLFFPSILMCVHQMGGVMLVEMSVK